MLNYAVIPYLRQIETVTIYCLVGKQNGNI